MRRFFPKIILLAVMLASCQAALSTGASACLGMAGSGFKSPGAPNSPKAQKVSAEETKIEEERMQSQGYKKVYTRCGPGSFFWMKSENK